MAEAAPLLPADDGGEGGEKSKEGGGGLRILPLFVSGFAMAVLAGVLYLVWLLMW